MIGPKGGGSKDFDSTLALIELIQDPEKYKKKLAELGESLKTYETQKTVAIDRVKEANKRIQVAEEMERAAFKTKALFDNEIIESEAELEQGRADLARKRANLMSNLEKMDDLEQGLKLREDNCRNFSAKINKQAEDLNVRADAIHATEREIERKQKILSQL